jgi:hypothetical protein
LVPIAPPAPRVRVRQASPAQRRRLTVLRSGLILEMSLSIPAGLKTFSNRLLLPRHRLGWQGSVQDSRAFTLSCFHSTASEFARLKSSSSGASGCDPGGTQKLIKEDHFRRSQRVTVETLCTRR